MTSKLYKVLLVLGIIAIIITIILYWFFYSASENLEVTFLDVGQGDSILVETPFGQNILIDGGPNNSVLKQLGANLAWWDKTIDLMILTHPHDDHVAGLVDVLKRYNTKKVIYTGLKSDSPEYLEWLEIIRIKNIPTTIIDKSQVINLGENCFLKTLHPQENIFGQYSKNLNNDSIVIKFVCSGKSFLFTGDIEEEVEKIIIDAYGNYLDVDFLKIAHHGSDTSSLEEVFYLSSPRYCIVTVGENNYGHPSLRVLKRLERNECEILRTDLSGNISFIINQKNGLKISTDN